MKSALHELYTGSIGFDNLRHGRDPAFFRAVEKKRARMDALELALHDTQKKLWEDYFDAAGDADAIARYELFRSSLQFAMLLMFELFGNES